MPMLRTLYTKNEANPINTLRRKRKMNLKLRLEQVEDYRQTEEVTREAFWNYYAPGCYEHYLVHIMRNSPSFVTNLDFLALVDDKIVGNIMYVESDVVSDEGKEYTVLTLGPISVLPEYQGKGIGSTLIKHTKELAKQMGYPAILLYGDPDYYAKQGFIPAEKLGIRTQDNMYAAALQVCKLQENALSQITGVYRENKVYEIDEEKGEEFDLNFPPKEKITGIQCQERFIQISAMRKEAR